MTEVKETTSSFEGKEIEPKEELKEKSEEEDSFWDYFARFPYSPFLFH
jgi:hypothetical protein